MDVSSPTASMTEERLENAQKPKLSALILLTILSMIYAEVYSGSAPIWFLEPFAYMLTVPLYGSHTILLLNLALRYRRTSIPHLYLFGMLFGLYESWITKVLWTGYPGSTGPQFGTVLGIAWGEFFTLVFLWHPIFAFMLPVLVFQVLCTSSQKDDDVVLLAGHERILRVNRRNAALWGLALLYGGVFMRGSQLVNLANVIVVSGINVLILFTVYYVAKHRCGELTIACVTLGRRGTAALAIYVVAQYVILFFILVPEKIPGFDAILPILVIYLAIGLLLRSTPKSDAPQHHTKTGLITFRLFLAWSTLLIPLSWMTVLVSDFWYIVSVPMMLAMLVGGPLIFIRLSRLVRRTGAAHQNTNESEAGIQ